MYIFVNKSLTYEVENKFLMELFSDGNMFDII